MRSVSNAQDIGIKKFFHMNFCVHQLLSHAVLFDFCFSFSSPSVVFVISQPACMQAATAAPSLAVFPHEQRQRNDTENET